MTGETEYLTYAEVATLCAVSHSAVKKWIHTGKLARVRGTFGRPDKPGRVTARVRRSDLERFLQECAAVKTPRKWTQLELDLDLPPYALRKH